MIITIELDEKHTPTMWKGELTDGEGYANYASDHNPQDVLNTLLSGYVMKKMSE